MKVFILYFLEPFADGKWGGQLRGIYSTQQQAAHAVLRFQERPAYSHYPKGFQVDCVELDQDIDEIGAPPPSPTPPPI